MNVVVDTQALFSSFVSEVGPARQLVDIWRGGGVTLCVSPEIMEEYFSVMVRLGVGGLPEMEEWLEIFRRQSHMRHVAPREHCNAVLHEPSDDKFVDCAVAAGAVAVIAGSRHLLLLRRFRGVLMLSPADFMYRYRNRSLGRVGVASSAVEREPAAVPAVDLAEGADPAGPTAMIPSPSPRGSVRESIAARFAGWRKGGGGTEEERGKG